MSDYKTIEEYLSVAEEQIRWKRARPVLSRELRQHLEDQRDAFAADGFEDAERMAVEEMGDPAETGAELDRIHRPRPQWGLLGMTIFLAIAGGFLRVWLSAGYGFNAFSPSRTALAVALGSAALLCGYFLDCSRLLCRPRTVYIAALVLSLLTLLPFYSLRRNGTAYYGRYLVQLFPVVYAVWLYAWRRKGWKGLFMAAAGGMPMVFICVVVPSLGNAVILMLSGLVLLLFAVRTDWFRISKPLAAVFLAGIAPVIISGVLLRYGGSMRIKAFIDPEMDPSCYGYQAVTVRSALSASRWLGTGAADFAPLPFEQYVPEWSRDFLLTTVIYRLGWLPFLLTVMAMLALVVWMMAKWLRNKAGQMLVLSVVMVFACRIALSVMINLGYVLFSAGFPLLTGNLQSMIDMSLIGLALSVFRSGSILRESEPTPKQSFHMEAS